MWWSCSLTRLPILSLRQLHASSLTHHPALSGLTTPLQAFKDDSLASHDIGLSAPQEGINVQLMVFNPAGEHGKGDEIVLINLKVTKYSKNTVYFNEGGLSFPGIYADVERPAFVKIDASDVTSASFFCNLSGNPTRVFHPGSDHLQALEKKYENKTGIPSLEKIEARKRKAAVGFLKS